MADVKASEPNFTVTPMERAVVCVALETYKQTKVRALGKEAVGSKMYEFLKGDIADIDNLIVRFK